MGKQVGIRLLQAILIFGYLTGISFLDQSLREITKGTFQLHPYMIFTQISYIPVGLFLGMGYFYRQVKEQGVMRINLVKLLILGGPSLYLLLVPYLIHVNSLLPSVLVTSTYTSPVAQVILGYVLVSSGTKES